MATMKAGGSPVIGVTCCEITLCVPPCLGETCAACKLVLTHRACGKACDLVKVGDTVKLPTGEEGTVLSVSSAAYGDSALEVL